MNANRKILVVDDEAHIVELLVMNLKQNGYDTCTASDGREVLEAAVAARPDLVLLDLMLPGLGGLEVCRQLRADPRTSRIPVIMLTAKSEESDKVIGLGIGADDYITKPFGLRELFARIEVALRRADRDGSQASSGPYRAGMLTVDVDGHAVSLDGSGISLSPTEFALLSALAKKSDRTVRRADLAAEAGLAEGEEAGRSLDVHMRNLRKKLGGADGRQLIQTVRGIGYRLHG